MVCSGLIEFSEWQHHDIAKINDSIIFETRQNVKQIDCINFFPLETVLHTSSALS